MGNLLNDFINKYIITNYNIKYVFLIIKTYN